MMDAPQIHFVFINCGHSAIQLCDTGGSRRSWLQLLLPTADETFGAIMETPRNPFNFFFFFLSASSSNFSTAAAPIDRPPGSADSPAAAGAPKCQPGCQLTSGELKTRRLTFGRIYISPVYAALRRNDTAGRPGLIVQLR